MTPLCKGKSLILWGTCTSGPRVRTFDNGKTKTTFSIRYDQKKNEDGEKISTYMDVEAWGKLAQYAACVERGDDLLCAGEYVRDNYRSEKKGEDVYTLKASIILPQAVADEMPMTSRKSGRSPRAALTFPTRSRLKLRTANFPTDTATGPWTPVAPTKSNNEVLICRIESLRKAYGQAKR